MPHCSLNICSNFLDPNWLNVSKFFCNGGGSKFVCNILDVYEGFITIVDVVISE